MRYFVYYDEGKIIGWLVKDSEPIEAGYTELTEAEYITELATIEVTYPVPFSEEEKKTTYEKLTVQYIREQYSVDDEAKITREFLANAENAQATFTAYNDYVESCKTKAYIEIYKI